MYQLIIIMTGMKWFVLAHDLGNLYVSLVSSDPSDLWSLAVRVRSLVWRQHVCQGSHHNNHYQTTYIYIYIQYVYNYIIYIQIVFIYIYIHDKVYIIYIYISHLKAPQNLLAMLNNTSGGETEKAACWAMLPCEETCRKWEH